MADGEQTKLPAAARADLVLAVVEVLRGLWHRRGLVGVRYERTLGAKSAVWGDEIPLHLTIWNRKILPLAWITVDDHVTQGATIRERPVSDSEVIGMGVVRNGWTLGPYERVIRELHIVADRRGRYRFGPVHLKAADLFAGGSTSEERPMPDAYLVVPRSVPLHGDRTRFKASTGERPAAGFLEDPALFAGLRPYEPGDPMRRIHWKAAARTGQIRSKRFDSSRERELLIALDIQTLPGEHWRMLYDEDLVEALCVAASSVARAAIISGAACGLVAAAYSESPQWQLRLAPARGPGQFLRIGESLARISPYASGPFEVLLASLPRWLSRPATVISISARDPEPYLVALRRLRAQGLLVRHVAIGPDARAARDRVARVGVPAQVGRLAPDWQTSDALELAG